MPSSPAYGVLISQLIRYTRTCSSYECFILRVRRLASKLLKISQSGSFIVYTGILFSNIMSPSHKCSMKFWPLTKSDFPTDQTFHLLHDLDTELDHHLLMSGFHEAFAMGVACQQGRLTLPDTWFRPPLCSNGWDQKSSEDMTSSRNLISTIRARTSPTVGDGTRCPEG